MSDDQKIDEKELEEKIHRVKTKSENPTAKEYGDKLAEFLDSKATARDNFINWITGLATGLMFLAFSKLSPAIPNEENYLFFSGISSFFCIISPLAFKILLEVRYSHLELELSLLKNIWEGHDIRTELNHLMQNNKDVTEEDKQKLLKNLNESLNYLDEGYINKLKKPINIKSKI